MSLHTKNSPDLHIRSKSAPKIKHISHEKHVRGDKTEHHRTKNTNKSDTSKKSFHPKKALFFREKAKRTAIKKSVVLAKDLSSEQILKEENIQEEKNNTIGERNIPALTNQSSFYHGARLYYKKAWKQRKRKNNKLSVHDRFRKVNLSQPINPKLTEELSKKYQKLKIRKSFLKRQTSEERSEKKVKEQEKANNRIRLLAFNVQKGKQPDKKQSMIQNIKSWISKPLLDKIGKKDFFLKRVAVYGLGVFVIISMPIILIIAVAYNSPFAIFLPSASKEETVMTVTSSYLSDFNQEVNALVEEHSDCDIGKLVYMNYEGDSASPSNYYDIIAIYMVRYGVGDMATVMNETTKQNLKIIFDEMCSYKTKVKTEKTENEDGETVTAQVYQVRVTLKTYRDMIEIFEFSEEETKLLETIMSPEYLAMLGGNSGDTSIGDGTSEELQTVISKISDADIKTVVKFALSKLGYPYSQAYRDSGTYYDCSSLTYYAWLSVGVNLTYEGANTAAQQAKLCNDKGYSVSYSEIQPGDLIFYSFGYNGRYKNISHVAMYCGDGMLVDASYSQQKVVYRKVYSTANIVMVGRPGGGIE